MMSGISGCGERHWESSLFIGKKTFKIFIIIMTILETDRFGVNLPLSRDVTK